jgi:uncharacterized membrane protein
MMMGFELLILAVIVWAVVQAMSRRSPFGGPQPASTQSAKEVLDARLARGEVTVEEYKKLRETIGVQGGFSPVS